jgi:hypothetical protein
MGALESRMACPACRALHERPPLVPDTGWRCRQCAAVFMPDEWIDPQRAIEQAIVNLGELIGTLHFRPAGGWMMATHERLESSLRMLRAMRDGELESRLPAFAPTGVQAERSES